MLISNGRCLPYNPELKDRARELRSHMTVSEIIIWRKVLKDSSYIFNRQKIIDNYIVDFYCAELSLIIEIDGESHYIKNGPEYDRNREVRLRSYGLNILRFDNNEVKKSLGYVKERLDEEIDKIIDNKHKTQN